jgi:hypothetical protein
MASGRADRETGSSGVSGQGGVLTYIKCHNEILLGEPQPLLYMAITREGCQRLGIPAKLHGFLC